MKESPMCFDCKKEKPVLYSVNRPGKNPSVALCEDCATADLKKQGLPLIK